MYLALNGAQNSRVVSFLADVIRCVVNVRSIPASEPYFFFNTNISDKTFDKNVLSVS